MSVWDGDPETHAARLRAEHGLAWHMGPDDEEAVMEVGFEALPPWPPEGHDLIPCPTCWLPAELVAPTAVDVLHHSRCPAGHDNSLAPAVLEHLRRMSE